MFQYDAFKSGKWQDSIDVRDFIQTNYTPYEGDAFPQERDMPPFDLDE